MPKLDLQQHSHRRFNPLTREWILVSPHRTQRPWQGQTETVDEAQLSYDPKCYMCPGNLRAGGERNPAYDGVFVFNNDFAALLPQAPADTYIHEELLVAQGEPGVCRVLCFSPRHDLTIARMSSDEMRQVVDAWTDQYRELSADPAIGYVQIFENRGAMMGCSNPHPHCQIWSSATVPNDPLTEQQSQAEYRQAHNNRCLLCDYARIEADSKERMVCENESFVAVVPFWATWPFETLVLSKRHLPDMACLQPAETAALADILKRLTVRYDNLFQTPFPYSMGFHQRPSDGPHPEWHFHAHFFPPLLRSATVRKFVVGYELLASPQRDITPESAAERLRQLPEVHYSEAHPKR
jgi:UDPglucose--hexose-1-phosphate uridylyltransferase